MARRKQQDRKPNPALERKQQLRQRKEAEERQTLLLIFGPVLAVVIGIVAIGAYREMYMKPRQPVARVDGQAILAQDYTARVQYERLQLLQGLQSFAQFAQVSADQPDFLSQFAEQSRANLPQRAVDRLVDDVLIENEATERGVEVTEAEIDEKIFSELPSGQPTADLRPREVVTGTGGITATATAGPVPTLSEDLAIASTREAQRDYDRIIRDGILLQTGLTVAQYRAIVRSELLREKLGEALGEEVDASAKQVELEYLLFASQETAEAALAMVETGATWAQVTEDFGPPEPDALSPEDPADLGEDGPTPDAADAEAPPGEESDDPGAADEEPAATATETATATPEAEDDELPAVGVTDGLTVTGEITTTGELTSTGPITTTADSPFPTTAPLPTPTPEPQAYDSGERKWYTRQSLKDGLGVGDPGAAEILDMEAGSTEVIMAGTNAILVNVISVEEDRPLEEQELEAQKAGALEAWLSTRRIQADVSRFPTESLTPPEPAWFQEAYAQLVGSTSSSISIGTIPAPPVDAPPPAEGPAVEPPDAEPPDAEPPEGAAP